MSRAAVDCSHESQELLGSRLAALIEESVMPAKSNAQQQAAGIALAAKESEKKVGDLKGASKSKYEPLNKKELHDLHAATKTKVEPKHKYDKKSKGRAGLILSRSIERLTTAA